MTTEEIIQINPFEVKFLIHRERDRERFENIKEAIRELGVQQPLHVRDISDWPAKERRRPDGGLYKWEAVFGEGRTTAVRELYKETKDERWLQLPAQVKDIPEAEIVGRFLAENLLRRDYPWIVQAQLIRDDIEDGESVQSVSKRYFVTKGHAAKLLRIINAASPKAQKEMERLTIGQAEILTSLPAKGQEIVIETLKEEGLEPANVAAIVRKAREVTKTQELSKTALKASLRRLDEDLGRTRESLRPVRLHHSLGPANLAMLLSDKPFRAALDKRGINYHKFAEAIT